RDFRSVKCFFEFPGIILEKNGATRAGAQISFGHLRVYTRVDGCVNTLSFFGLRNGGEWRGLTRVYDDLIPSRCPSARWLAIPRHFHSPPLPERKPNKM